MINTDKQQTLFPNFIMAESLKSNTKNARSGTFTDNMKLPIHRWFRYSAGFSAEWVKTEITSFEEKTGKMAKLFDPFVGSGTTTITACELGNV